MRRSRSFVDTNILLYLFDPADARKREKATKLVEGLASNLFVSTQVLQEFFTASTRKLGLDKGDAREFVSAFDRQRVVPSSAEFVLNAIDLSIVTGYTIWDCLILQAAIEAKCDRIYSEDMQHGRLIKGVRIENPFLDQPES